MRVEIPQLKRCCFCMPLRRGLLLWVYLKLAVALFVICTLVTQIILSSGRHRDDIFYIVTSVAFIVYSLETIFDIIFLIGAHRKNFAYLRIYYRYALVMCILEGISVLVFIGFEIYFICFGSPYIIFIIQYMAETTCFLIGQLLIQMYFVILVRSELHKLENNTQFEFVNHASEPECKAQIVV